MSRIILLTLLFVGVTSHFSVAQLIGSNFPELTAETVKDEAIAIPQDTKGKFTLIGLAYSKKSEDDLNTWFSPIYNKFIAAKSGNGGLFSSFTYDVNVYFVPMFTGVKAAAAGTAKKKALKNVDPLLLPYVLFYKGKLKPYKESLSFTKKDVPYFFVLDSDGKIVYSTSGAYSEDKMDQIEEVLDEE